MIRLMPRTTRTILAILLLIALPTASLVASGHVHPGSACANDTCGDACAASPPSDTDQPLCPVCELAKSLHAAAPAPPTVLPLPAPAERQPAVPAPPMPERPGILPASRSPPVC